MLKTTSLDWWRKQRRTMLVRWRGFDGVVGEREKGRCTLPTPANDLHPTLSFQSISVLKDGHPQDTL